MKSVLITSKGSFNGWLRIALGKLFLEKTNCRRMEEFSQGNAVRFMKQSHREWDKRNRAR